MARNSVLSRIRALFNKGKYLIDLLDNLWSACRGALPAELIPILTPFILGLFGCIVHLGEGIEAVRCAYRAYKNGHARQWKTRLVSSLLITLLAGAGFGMAVVLLASSVGLVVSAVTQTVASFLIPGLLTAISSLTLWRRAYIFSQYKEKEEQAKQEYDFVLEAMPNPGCSLKEKEAIALQIEMKKKDAGKWREKRLFMEREMAFNLVGLVASSLVMVSTVMGTAALVGASAASLGAFPLVLMVIGMASGILCQLVEYGDRRCDFRFTRDLRNEFIKLWERFFGERPASTPKPQPKRPRLSSFIHERLAEESLIELSPLQRPKLYPVMSPSVEFPLVQAASTPVSVQRQELFPATTPSVEPFRFG